MESNSLSIRASLVICTRTCFSIEKSRSICGRLLSIFIMLIHAFLSLFIPLVIRMELTSGCFVEEYWSTSDFSVLCFRAKLVHVSGPWGEYVKVCLFRRTGLHVSYHANLDCCIL